MFSSIYASADINETGGERERYIVAGIEAMPHRREKKHAEGFATAEALECDRSHPLACLHVPVVDDALDARALLNGNDVHIFEQVPLGLARRLVEAVEAEAARVMHSLR